jgi:uncharacterized protein (TIGR02246 family)
MLVGVVVVVLAAASAEAQQAEVESAVSDMLAAWEAGDFESFSKFYDPDTRGFFLDGGLLLQGFNVAALTAAYNSGFRADFEVRDLSVRVLGDVALAAAYLDGSLTLPGGNVLEGTWRYSDTRVASEEGWLIVQYHFSEQSPPEGG